MLVTNTITMAIDRQQMPPVIDAVQGEANSRAIKIQLTKDGLPWAVPSGASCFVRFGKPDKTGGIYDTLEDGTSAVEIGDNYLQFLLVEQVISFPGDVFVQVEMTKNGASLSTFPVVVRVQEDKSIGAFESKDYYNLRKYVYEEVQTLLGGISPSSGMTVTFSSNASGGYTADKTYDEIDAAHSEGFSICGVFIGSSIDVILGDIIAEKEQGYYSFSGQVRRYAGDEPIPIESWTAILHSDDTVEVFRENIDTTDTAPVKLPNPNALTIEEVSYDGSDEVDMTGAVEAVVDRKMMSVKRYGAKGDGSTDDTAAFQAALAAERVVYVPGGTYVLNDTLVIRPNCCLGLSQDTVLKFTQTNKHGITMHRLAHLKGNHATIFVPYTFSKNVINCDGGDDYALLDNTSDTTLQTTNATAVPPFKKWDPQWKMSRYVTDINICKVTDTGSVGTSNFHYSADGTCYGKAIYIHCNEADWPVNYMWGVNMSGVRIAGGFEYGIRIHNIGDPVASWNHDMRIEALIDACKIGVSIENCRYARLAVTIQPRTATDGTVYAEHGFELIDSCGIDLSQSRVWDWNERITKWAFGNKYQHVAMIGDCHSLILDDYRYNSSSIDIRDFIYTDNARNLETMIVRQEPITRWFKTKDGVPYFYNGKEDKKLVSDEELQSHFKTDYVSNDVLRTATDTDGTIYNEIGYKNGAYLSNSGGITTSSYYSVTGFIPITAGHTFYTKDMTLVDADGLNRLCLYDKDKNLVKFASLLTALTEPSKLDFLTCWEFEDGFAVTLKDMPSIASVAYIRFSVWKKNVSDAPMVAIDEEVQLKAEGFLADGIKVKGNAVVLTSPSGRSFLLSVSDSGALSTTEYAT